MSPADSDILSRVVRLLERLDAADPWQMTHDELEQFIDTLGYDAGELLEERRRQQIIAAVSRPYDYP
jgi:hypothetical protein